MSVFETSGAAPTGDTGARIGAATDTRPPTAGVLEELSRAFAAARATISNFLDLLSSEARRAGIALTWMMVCGVVAAICIVTAWLGLMLAVALAAMSFGVPVSVAVIAVALINGAAGAVLIYVGIGMSQALLFSATRRQVAGQCPVKPSAS